MLWQQKENGGFVLITDLFHRVEEGGNIYRRINKMLIYLESKVFPVRKVA